MIYQNSIDITIEALKGLTKRATGVETNGLKIFDDYFQLFSNLDELHNNISLYDMIQKSFPDISGFPGTQDEALKTVSSLLGEFFSSINKNEIESNDLIESYKQENLVSAENSDKCLNNLCLNSRQIDSIKYSINDNKHQLPAKLNKYQKSINGIVTLKTKIKKQSEITKLWEKIMKIRNDNIIFQRSNFVPIASKCNDMLVEDSKNSTDLLKKQFSIRKDILSTIIKSNDVIISNIDELSIKLASTKNMINFHDDFHNFITTHKIIRYDILPDEFKPLDFSHELFSEIPKVSNVLSFQLYPYSMAKVKKEFMAEYQNEITIKKGKIVLLMEDLSLPWVFIQKPYTNEMGYVPSSFLEEIGKGIGVLLNEFQASDDLLSKGDYVAIESNDDPDVYKVHTITDFVVDVPANLIAKISEV